MLKYIGSHRLINVIYIDNFTKDDKTHFKMTGSELCDHGNDFKIVYSVLSFTFQNLRHEVRNTSKLQL